MKNAKVPDMSNKWNFVQYHTHKHTVDFLIYLLSGLTKAEVERPEEDFRFRHEEHRTPLSGLEMSRQGPASG